jgi:integration host factor subunit alpha
MTLTKAHIIKAISEVNGYPKKESADIMESLVEIIKRTLESREDLTIAGFGRFSVRDKSKRKGRNPATGHPMMLKSRRVVTYRCSGKLRGRLNG